MQGWQLQPTSSNPADQALKQALWISCIAHLLLFLILPDLWLIPERKPRQRLIPLKLVTIKPEPKPKPIKKKIQRKKKSPPPKPKQPPKPKPTPKSKPTSKPQEAKQIIQGLISSYVKDIPQYHPAKKALPEIPLPESFSEDLPEIVLPKHEEFFSEEEFFDDIGDLLSTGEEKTVITEPLPEGIRQSPRSSPAGIKWKGTPRKTLHQPPLPKISSKVEGDIQLKFWVDRNGRVSQVIPLKKLDARLEGIATDYIRKWRFESLPAKEDYLQWGIITLKIRLD